MKRFKYLVVALITGISLMASGMVMAQGRGMGRNWNSAPADAQGNFQRGPGYTLRSDMYEARIDVLAELSGKSRDEVLSKLRYKPMWAVLDEYGVNFDTYQKRVHEKAKGIVNQAVQEGKITQAQADFMLERMSEGPRAGAGGPGRGYGKSRGRGPGFGGYGGNCPWR